jgi:hypothetical protein
VRCKEFVGKRDLIEVMLIDDVKMILPPFEFGVMLTGDLDIVLSEENFLDVIDFSNFESAGAFQDSDVVFADLDGANIGARVGDLYFFASFVDVEENELVLCEGEDFVSEDFEENDVCAEFL